MSGVIEAAGRPKAKPEGWHKGFTPDQAQRYYENRMEAHGGIRKSGASYMGLCPFHDDKTRSMSFNFQKGVWHCHTEHIGGGMIDFEKRLLGVSDLEAVAGVNAVIGIAQGGMSYGGKPEATYGYRDEQDRLLYEVLRYRDPATGKKRITVRRPNGTGWEYTVEGTRRVPYRLPELIRAREVFIVEGEKCVEAVREGYNALLGETDACEQRGMTATTSPFGAGKWNDAFAPFFAGKKVVIIPDNDVAGRGHMEMVARSVSKFAVGVKWLELPVENPKDDVADFLKTHNFGDLQAIVAAAPMWRKVSDSGLFQTGVQFMRNRSTQVDWLVRNVIEVGTSGFILALPKGGKSVAVASLAVSLASGEDWLGFHVKEPVRVAMVSREDAAGLTARRLHRAILGLNRSPDDEIWERNLHVNTREQSAALSLEDDGLHQQLITTLQEKRIDFCILDVLNVLHDADENDNTEMRRVLNRVQQIRTEVGCQICIVHHASKEMDDSRTLSQLARGASAIAGFAEFNIGLRLIDEATKTRQMRFETKSAEPHETLYWKIRDVPLTNALVLERVEYQDGERQSPRKRAARLVQAK